MRNLLCKQRILASRPKDFTIEDWVQPFNDFIVRNSALMDIIGYQIETKKYHPVGPVDI